MTITACPHCNKIYAGQTCPNCGKGFPYEVKKKVEDLNGEETFEIFHPKIAFEGH